MYKETIRFIKSLYNTDDFIALHEPKFKGNEKLYLNQCIDSTFVSSVGKFVNKLEEKIANYTSSKYAIATVNGTSALHTALIVANIEKDDEVITQSLSFIATANAISYIGAKPIFLDVDKKTLGLSHKALKKFLEENTYIKNDKCINRSTGKTIKACVPMHTFGHPCKIDKIVKICKEYNIKVIEDAAESLGSFYKKKHTGTFGEISAISFNGNKIITSGGGGVILTDDEKLAKKAKHLTTTSKVPHPYEYIHDEIGYNYRMPNLNAALLLAQLEQLDEFLRQKKKLAKKYKNFFSKYKDLKFIEEPKNCNSNYWLNAIILKNEEQKEQFLKVTNKNQVMTRPVWKLLNELDMYKNCQSDDLTNSKYLQKHIINIPSGVI
ncbi:MAG: LegC family aminotransferase [Campylobacterota bacterium]